MSARLKAIAGTTAAPAALACAALLVYILLRAPQASVDTVTVNVQLACFLGLAAIGQLVVIASGEGAIDLSIPFVITLTGFVAPDVANSVGVAAPLVAVLVGIGVGLLVGLVNSFVVQVVHAPPIIGTLAVGFMASTAVQRVAESGQGKFDDKGLVEAVRADVFHVPVLALFVLAVGVLAWVMVQRAPWGRRLLAIGQSREAARLSGLPVRQTILSVYLVSGALAGLTGVLLAANTGSGDLAQGTPYLLASIGAVLLGGTAITGGAASVGGTLLGALLLTLLATAVTLAGLPVGMQNVATGLVVSLVLLIRGGAVLGREANRSRGRAFLRSLRGRGDSAVPGAG